MIKAFVALLACPTWGTSFIPVWTKSVEVDGEPVVITPDYAAAPNGSRFAIQVTEPSGSINFAAAITGRPDGWRSEPFAANRQGRRVRIERGALVCLCRNGLSPLAGFPAPDEEPAGAEALAGA